MYCFIMTVKIFRTNINLYCDVKEKNQNYVLFQNQSSKENAI